MSVVAMMKPESKTPNTGLEDNARKSIAEALTHILADSYTLYIKTHFYHWNVTGMQFQALHALFEEQYTELATAVDELAERIRSLGYYAPGSLWAFSELKSIDEDKQVPETAQEMVTNLLDAHEILIRSLREAVSQAADAGDEVTAGLLTDRLTTHEKTAWMLRSLSE